MVVRPMVGVSIAATDGANRPLNATG
jgi:hypothetical protein